jgi:hypothetical protein
MSGAISLLSQEAFMSWCLVNHRDNPFKSFLLSSYILNTRKFSNVSVYGALKFYNGASESTHHHRVQHTKIVLHKVVTVFAS